MDLNILAYFLRNRLTLCFLVGVFLFAVLSSVSAGEGEGATEALPVAVAVNIVYSFWGQGALCSSQNIGTFSYSMKQVEIPHLCQVHLDHNVNTMQQDHSVLFLSILKVQSEFSTQSTKFS